MKTQDIVNHLVKFTKTTEWKYSSVEFREYIYEIIKKLWELDKLKSEQIKRR